MAGRGTVTAPADRTFRVSAAVDDVYGYRCLLTVDAGTVTLEIGRLSWYLPRMGATIRHEDRPMHLVRNPFATPWLRFVLMLYDDHHRAAVTMGRRTAEAVLDALRPDGVVERSTARFASWGPADLPLLQYRWLSRGTRRRRNQ